MCKKIETQEICIVCRKIYQVEIDIRSLYNSAASICSSKCDCEYFDVLITAGLLDNDFNFIYK